MRHFRNGAVVCAAGAGLWLAAVAGAVPAQAQLLNQLENALPGGQGGAGGAAGGMLPSVSQASLPNLAGVLEYCVRNSLVSGSGTSSIASSLLGKAGGNAATSTPQYQAGSSGKLETGGNSSYDLNGGGLVADLKQQVCNLVLQHAKSLL